ncbi:MAG: chemotaxis protein CheB [Desulfuromonadales bacterium]|nr:chemotaxis protein CheB [Desulfuromonadales bacterium]
MSGRPRYQLVVIGVSAGGLKVLKSLLGALPGDFPWPILIVQHLRAGGDSSPAGVLRRYAALRLKEADAGEPVVPRTAYFAPANYHLLLERDLTLALSVDPPVRYARPSVDVLFESAADAVGAGVIGIVLTGANDDGSAGLQAIRSAGGLVIAQDPDEAEVAQMPLAAIHAGPIDHILPLAQIASLLCDLAGPEMPS